MIEIALALAGLAAVAVAARRFAPSGEVVTLGLTFPRTVTPDQVVTAARSLAGLLPPWWRRLFSSPSVTLESQASAEGIAHVLTVPAGRVEYVTGALRAAVPGLRVIEAEPGGSSASTLARELRVGGAGDLRTNATDSTNAGLLAALQPLAADERAVIQTVITPTERNAAVAFVDRVLNDDEPEPPTEPQFAVAVRVGVSAATPARSRQLVARLLGPFHVLAGPEARLIRRLLPSGIVAGRIGQQTPGRSIIGADELAALWAVPVDAPELPGLTLGRSRELPPAASVPRRGLVLGDAIVPGAARPVAVTQAEARRGLHVCAPTGSGKSTVCVNLAVQLMAAKSRPGLVLIDSKGDTASDLLDRIPAARRRDVIVFDPTDAEPVGFNLIGGSGESDLIVDHLVSELRHRYGAAGLGPRSEDILRAALTTLTTEPGRYTLCEVEPLLTNPAFRQKLVGRLDEPTLEGFWAWFAALSPAAQSEAIAPLGNKLRSFTMRRRVRAVIGQADGLDLGAALDGGKIVVISLAKGLLGKDAAALIGAAMVSRLWTAIQARAGIPAADRHPATVMADEFQDLAALSPVFAEAVAQSRGYKVGWMLAHQHLGQLDPDTRQAVLANLRSRVVMQTSAADATTFAREFRPFLSPDDLQGLGAFEGYAAVSVGAAVAPPANIQTRPAPDALGSAEQVRAASRKRYGMTPAAVDAAIRKRVTARRPAAPVGETERAA